MSLKFNPVSGQFDFDSGAGSITALTGDVTATGPGSVAATIANSAVTNAKVASGIDAAKLADGSVSNAEFQRLDGVTSSIQTQIDTKVAGPASATDNAITRFDSTTGKLVQNSGATIDDSGNITATNLSGTNTGDVTLTAVGAAPSANGASLSGQALTLQPADGTHPGVITSGAQTIGGAKTFSGAISASNLSGTNTGDQTISLTSDVTGSGTGSFTTTVAKIQGTTVSGTTGSGNVVFSSGPTLSSPVVGTQTQGDSSTKAASTAYVDLAISNAVAGVNPAVAVQAATTSASDTSGLTYNNGVSGVGATFTGTNNTPLVIDGFTFTALGQRLLIKNDTQSPSGAFNGVYYVTQVQTAILPPILTRALDYNSPSDINNTGAIPVINGTVNTTTSWVQTAQVVTVGTTPLVFVEFSRNPADYLLKTTGDLDQTSFAGANSQSSATNVTGLAFANASVRSFHALVSVYVNATSSLYEEFQIDGIQRGSGWQISVESVGDNSLVVFSITSAGQIQYTSSTYSGFVSMAIRFRALVTAV